MRSHRIYSEKLATEAAGLRPWPFIFRSPSARFYYVKWDAGKPASRVLVMEAIPGPRPLADAGPAREIDARPILVERL